MLLDRRRLAYQDYFDWYEGDMTSLFNELQPDNINGLALIPPAHLSTRYNYFGAVSRFFIDAMLSDLPTITPSERLLLERVTEHWGVTGEACIVQASNGLRAVRPDYVFPVYDQYDKDTLSKIVLVFPERRPDQNQGTSDFDFGSVPETNRTGYADKARVIEYDVATATATMAVRNYTRGNVEDFPKGEAVDVRNIVWINTKDGVYNQMSTLVREITVRMNIIQRFLNQVSNSVLQIDTGAISSGDLNRGVTLDGVNQAADKGLGLTVSPPFIGEEGARFIERNGAGLSESLDYMRMLLGQLGVISGVPDYVFGVNLGRPADETERIMFTGQARVKRFSESVELAFSMVNLTVKLPSEHFVTAATRVSRLLEQFDKGAITLNELREALGRSPLNNGDNVTEQPNMAVRFMRMLTGGNNGNS